MTWPKDYQATDPEVQALCERVIQDHRDKMEKTRAEVREFQESGKESVE